MNRKRIVTPLVSAFSISFWYNGGATFKIRVVVYGIKRLFKVQEYRDPVSR